MKTRERHVHFYDLRPRTAFHGSEVVPLQMTSDRALQLAHEAWGALPTAPTFRDGARQISIDAWEHSSGRGEHYLVVNCADPGLADVAFKHLRSGRARMAGKLDEEAIDASAHLLIKPPTRGAGAAVMLMTNGAGLSAAKMGTMLGRLLRSAKALHPTDFQRDHPDAVQGKTVSVHVKFEVAGHQSRFLQQILAQGQIESMELIAEGRTALDGDREFQVTGHVVQVEAVAHERPMTLDRLRRLMTRAQPDLTKARIRFKESAEAQTETHTFEANALERAFVRKDRITFDTDIGSRYTVVNHTVVDRLRALL